MMAELRASIAPESAPEGRLWPRRHSLRDSVRAALTAPAACASVLAVLAAAGFILPAAWPAAAFTAALYAGWMSQLRFRLPMRAPASWPGRDYGDLKDGSDAEYRSAAGILFLGVDRDGHELWISNSDARRHIFTLGTTGSGKTEFLLGLLVQPMMWGSGCMFVDGKGTPEFYARVYSLAKRFGREDDVRLINFTGVAAAGGADPDAPAGSAGAQSNTLNPFARGTADQLANMVASLMGGESGDQMWRDRAVQLISTLIRALVEMRDSGEVLLDVQTLRDYMPLGAGVPGGVKPRQTGDSGHIAALAKRLNIPPSAAAGLEAVSREQWETVRRETTMTALYLRALKGDFSRSTLLALQGFMNTLPGFSLAKALSGTEQEAKTLEQHGYLTMQLTKPLGTMADDFGHIFRTPLAEVDMEDVVLNRRILVVLLPALQKAPEETRNLGRIIVAMAKSMMGAASGSRVVGSRREIVETAPTRSSSPFLAVFDEAGYYLVKGMDVMAAQARSLGFSIVVGAQDLQAMRGDTPQAADSIMANTYLNAVGSTVDADATLRFIQAKTGRQRVAMSSGGERRAGLISSAERDKGDYNWVEVDRTTAGELRALAPGEFRFIFQDGIHDGRSFYVGDRIVRELAISSFLQVRGPTDRAPGRADAAEEAFQRGMLDASRSAAADQPKCGPTPQTDACLILASQAVETGLEGAGLFGGGLAARCAAAMLHLSTLQAFQDDPTVRIHSTAEIDADPDDTADFIGGEGLPP